MNVLASEYSLRDIAATIIAVLLGVGLLECLSENKQLVAFFKKVDRFEENYTKALRDIQEKITNLKEFQLGVPSRIDPVKNNLEKAENNSKFRGDRDTLIEVINKVEKQHEKLDSQLATLTKAVENLEKTFDERFNGLQATIKRFVEREASVGRNLTAEVVDE